MTPWSIQWTEQALRDLNRLDRPIARRVVSKLEQAASDPERYFRRLVASEEWKLRIRDYRLLAIFLYDARTIYVERVDHRSRIYERGR